MKKVLLVLADAAILVLSGLLSILFRFDGFAHAVGLRTFWHIEPLVIPFQLAILAAFGLYNRLWRYASVSEMSLLVLGVTAANIFASVMFLLLGQGFPRSILVLAWALSLLVMGAVRFWGRIRHDFTHTWRARAETRRRTLIFGAGGLARLLIMDLRSAETEMSVVGIIDDDRSKVGYRFAGVKVLGTREDLVRICRLQQVSELIIAIRDLAPSVLRQLLKEMQPLGIRVNVASLSYSGERPVLRSINLNDLLRRPPVEPNLQGIRSLLSEKCVLVTGAGGSIGSEICRQVAEMNPACLLLLGHGENSIYDIHRELQGRSPGMRSIPIIADVRDRFRLNEVFTRYKPHVVFHAAAHKHVPLMEGNVKEAISNNVLGTAAVLAAATHGGTECVVVISSDKAVAPTSVMGLTKKMAEEVATVFAQKSPTRCLAVRFGNVLGSRGSVIPLFEEQIRQGGPVTVTHPEMKRYFMTISEAAQLVLQTAAMGSSGEIYVLDMEMPIPIVELAEDMIRMHGLEPGQDIEVRFSGIRPGEKLEELLVDEGDTLESTAHEKISRLAHSGTSDARLPGNLPRLLANLVEAELQGARTGLAGDEDPTSELAQELTR